MSLAWGEKEVGLQDWPRASVEDCHSQSEYASIPEILFISNYNYAYKSKIYQMIYEIFSCTIFIQMEMLKKKHNE